MRITGNSGIGAAGDALAQAAGRRPRIVVVQGSARSEDNCPNQFGKTRALLKHAMQGFDVDFDVIDLAVKDGGDIVQPCKACVSTAGGFHCQWFCSCYSKNDKKSPDFMHNNDVYARLERADGLAVFSPINWYAPSSVVKSFFDRLVCANLTITKEQAEKLTDGDIKNKDKTRALEKSGKYDHLLKNHLEGKHAAFFVHGDDGAADYVDRKPPESFAAHLIAMRNGLDRKSEGLVNNPKEAIMPIVWQCRYSGIHVPDDLVVGVHVNRGVSYSEANDKSNEGLFEMARELMANLVRRVTGSA